MDQKREVYRLLANIRKYPNHRNVQMSLEVTGHGVLWAEKPFCRKCDKYKLFSWNSYTEAIEKLSLYNTNLGMKNK